MSMTYTDTDKAVRSGATTRIDADAPIVPNYLNRPRRPQKKMRSWMILTPVGGLTLLGAASAVLMNPMDRPAPPLVEPIPTVLPARPTSGPVSNSPNATGPALVAEPAPIAPAGPTRSAAIRSASPSASVRDIPAVGAATEPTGLRPYASDVNTRLLNTTPPTSQGGIIQEPSTASPPLILTRPITPPQA